MNILAAYYYAQNFYIKIIEPYISNTIIKSTIENKNHVILYIEKEMPNLISACDDNELIEEIIYSHNEISKDDNLEKIYFNYISCFINDFCIKNKINNEYNNNLIKLSW